MGVAIIREHGLAAFSPKSISGFNLDYNFILDFHLLITATYYDQDTSIILR